VTAAPAAGTRLAAAERRGRTHGGAKRQQARQVTAAPAAGTRLAAGASDASERSERSGRPSNGRTRTTSAASTASTAANGRTAATSARTSAAKTASQASTAAAEGRTGGKSRKTTDTNGKGTAAAFRVPAAKRGSSAVRRVFGGGKWTANGRQKRRRRQDPHEGRRQDPRPRRRTDGRRQGCGGKAGFRRRSRRRRDGGKNDGRTEGKTDGRTAAECSTVECSRSHRRRMVQGRRRMVHVRAANGACSGGEWCMFGRRREERTEGDFRPFRSAGKTAGKQPAAFWISAAERRGKKTGRTEEKNDGRTEGKTDGETPHISAAFRGRNGGENRRGKSHQIFGTEGGTDGGKNRRKTTSGFRRHLGKRTDGISGRTEGAEWTPFLGETKGKTESGFTGDLISV